VPVVTLICHGHHVNSPFFNLPDHKVKGTEAEMTCLLRPEELETLSAEEIQKRIEAAFVYDDYTWQAEKRRAVTYPGRAEGLHKVLYQCPNCGAEYRMSSSGTTLRCDACGKTWTMDEYGALHATEGETEFPHIPDWYEWERGNVRREVRAGTYGATYEAHVSALPNPKRYIDLGKAVLTHDMTGFTVKGRYNGEEYEMKLAAVSQYSVHIEYEYLGKYGDCVDLNTLDDTLYVYPEGKNFSVTKMALATEELYAFYNGKNG
jgi:ribosomal protein L37AE/L43A